MNPETIAKIIRVAADAVVGAVNPADVARAVVAVGLELVPEEDLRAYLDEEAAKRAETIADAAERLKFGGPT